MKSEFTTNEVEQLEAVINSLPSTPNGVQRNSRKLSVLLDDAVKYEKDSDGWFKVIITVRGTISQVYYGNGLMEEVRKGVIHG